MERSKRKLISILFRISLGAFLFKRHDKSPTAIARPSTATEFIPLVLMMRFIAQNNRSNFSKKNISMRFIVFKMIARFFLNKKSRSFYHGISKTAQGSNEGVNRTPMTRTCTRCAVCKQRRLAQILIRVNSA